MQDSCFRFGTLSVGLHDSWVAGVPCTNPWLTPIAPCVAAQQPMPTSIVSASQVVGRPGVLHGEVCGVVNS